MTRPIDPRFHHDRPDPRRVPLHEGELRRIGVYLSGGLKMKEVAALAGVSPDLIWRLRRDATTTTSAHGRG